MLKRMNTQGQTAVEPWVIGLIILIIGGGILGYLYYTVWGISKDTLANVPAGALSSAKLICENLAKNSLGEADFCTSFKKISGNVYATCSKLETKYSFAFQKVFTCTSVTNSQLIKDFCKIKILAGDGSDYLEVEEQKCKDIVNCNDLSGTNTRDKSTSCGEGRKTIKKGFSSADTENCCVSA